MASPTPVAAEDNRKRIYDAYVKQRDNCQNFLDEEKKSGGSQVQLLQKALLSAELSLGLLKMKGVDTEKAFKQSLQKHVESVLDSTYYQENILVDEDFPESSCVGRMTEIIGQISGSISVTGNSSQALSILGKDVEECLHWRPGALMYMYCCTVMNNEERRPKTDSALLKQCCRLGVQHFKKMFQVHVSPTEEDYCSNDENVARQLQAGIRSDTHMLALAYGGELCFWYHKLLQDKGLEEKGSQTSSSHTADATVQDPVPDFCKLMTTLCGGDPIPGSEMFDPVADGKDFLSRYINGATTQGSVTLQSAWSCDRPQEIMREFNKIK